MLVAPGEDDVIRFIGAWKAWTTRLSWGLGNVNALWQPGMWDRTIRDTRDFDATITYILDNPVKAGLVEQPEQWAHSWAYWYDDDP